MLLRAEPPANGGFMVAAYVLVAVVLVIYAATLVLRARALSREVQE
jgi:hypothetical protein